MELKPGNHVCIQPFVEVIVKTSCVDMLRARKLRAGVVFVLLHLVYLLVWRKF